MAVEFREESRREAIIGTVAIHALLAAIFFFTVFKGPDPPLTFGGDGVELNYGVDEAGSGDIQSMAPANASKNREDSRPPASNPDPQPRPAPVATPVREQPSQEKIVTSEAEESPVKVPPVTTPSPPKEEVAETPAPPKPVERPRTLYTPKGSANGGGNGSNGTSNTPTGNNNGDRAGAVGDQGNPNGSLDAKALYGQPGSGGSGSSPGSGGLEMSGWAFDTRPRPPMIGNENGYVRFRVKINEDGEVESVQKVGGNVSPAQVQACIDEINRTASFKRTQSGNTGATGYITFKFETR
ncbi:MULTISPECIES: hypothetical protein [Hymenobacter]|uniref:Energy transducer TonB n=1 Tax=Hymenobacter jejuensis TaxID=2502781 RepID=A0A5B8A445_9BACT|nr:MULTISPECIES: hypothetical protein [Hymenobacter]MBC6989983.1 hypothetical protein [Hymenobacter sp. BT491]QDA62017.1 hypothetical protein FHG12_18760 [Hymenobacter jejuensis]